MAGRIVAVKKTRTAESGQVVVARFGDDTLPRFVWVDERHVELRPEGHNQKHKVMKIDLGKHILDVDSLAVGAMIGAFKTCRSRQGFHSW